MFASGGKLGEAKASKALADTFVARFPRKILELKHRQTSGIMKWPAISMESSKFATASVFRSATGV